MIFLPDEVVDWSMSPDAAGGRGMVWQAVALQGWRLPMDQVMFHWQDTWAVPYSSSSGDWNCPYGPQVYSIVFLGSTLSQYCFHN